MLHMRIHAQMHTRACMHARTYAHTHTRARAHTHIHTHMHTQIQTHTSARTCKHTCTFRRTHTHRYVRANMYMHTKYAANTRIIHAAHPTMCSQRWCPQMVQLKKEVCRTQQLAVRLLEDSAAPSLPPLREPSVPRLRPDCEPQAFGSLRRTSSRSGSTRAELPKHPPPPELDSRVLARLVSLLGARAEASQGLPTSEFLSSGLPSPLVAPAWRQVSFLGEPAPQPLGPHQSRPQQKQQEDGAALPGDPISRSFCFEGDRSSPLLPHIQSAGIPMQAPSLCTDPALPAGSPLTWPYAMLKARRSSQQGAPHEEGWVGPCSYIHTVQHLAGYLLPGVKCSRRPGSVRSASCQLQGLQHSGCKGQGGQLFGHVAICPQQSGCSTEQCWWGQGMLRQPMRSGADSALDSIPWTFGRQAGSREEVQPCSVRHPSSRACAQTAAHAHHALLALRVSSSSLSHTFAFWPCTFFR